MDRLCLIVDGFVLGEPFVANGLNALADAALLRPRLSLLIVAVVLVVTVYILSMKVLRFVKRS